MTVDLATIHHEGAGSPSDTARGADGGYTYWIGTTRWTRLRSVATSYATKGANHVSVDICLSGNRMDHAVTDNDLRLIHGAFMDAYGRGEVIAAPRVRAHKETFSTACPGDRTMARWASVQSACRVPVAPAIDWAALAKLEAWRKRVHVKTLYYGQRSADVKIMNDLLKVRGYLSETGDKYGLRSWAAVNHFKVASGWPKGPSRSGRGFGGKAADAILA